MLVTFRPSSNTWTRISQIDRGCVRCSTHRAEVLVEPRERFLDQLRARHVVPALVQLPHLVRFTRPEEAEERLLRRLTGEEEVVLAVQHQHRTLDAWQVVD